MSTQNIRTREERIFKEAPIPKAVATMAVPTVIGQLVVLIYNLADTYFIGMTNNPILVAASSLILPVFNITSALSSVIGLGGGTLISRLLGVDKRDEAERVSAFTFNVAVIIGAVWSLIVLLLMNPILNLLGASSETYGPARQYALCVIVMGGIPTLLQLVCAQLLRAVGCSKQSGFGMSLGGILNVLLDPLFMFVIMPRGNEIVGAGIATMLSNIVTLLYFLWVIRGLRGTTVLRLSPRHKLPTFDNIKSVFVNGFPSGVSNFLFDISQIMINRLMSHYGDIPLAAIGIVLKAERIPLNTGVGICQGTIPIVAYNYSAKNYKRMKKTINFSRKCGLIVATVSILIYELLAPQIMFLFIRDSATIEIGAQFLRVRCLATPFMFLAFHTLFSVQAMGKGQVAMWLAVIRQLLLYIPILLLMNYFVGMFGLVWAQILGDIVTDAISLVWFYRLLSKTYDSESCVG